MLRRIKKTLGLPIVNILPRLDTLEAKGSSRSTVMVLHSHHEWVWSMKTSFFCTYALGATSSKQTPTRLEQLAETFGSGFGASCKREPKRDATNHRVLRSILDNIQSSPFLSVMVDETTDKSNREQPTLIMRWVSNDLLVGEEFLGLCCLSSTDAQSIVDVMKDAFLRFQIPTTKLCGQCYDG